MKISQHPVYCNGTLRHPTVAIVPKGTAAPNSPPRVGAPCLPTGVNAGTHEEISAVGPNRRNTHTVLVVQRRCRAGVVGGCGSGGGLS